MGTGSNRELPSGTVTFLFTDIEGSTKLLQDVGSRKFEKILMTHTRLLRTAFEGHGGVEVRPEGDALFVTFSSAESAMAAAVEAQRAIQSHPWPEGLEIRVRMGLHTGEGNPVEDDYVGIDVHRAARIASAAHGGQILISSSTRDLTARSLPTEITLRDLGDHQLKDLDHLEHLYQVVVEGLTDEFPPLRSLDISSSVPEQPTSFVGRREQLREAGALLKRSRLLTFTGPGGTGKTRLAVELAGESKDDFPDGVFFVPLDTINDPGLVPSAIADKLGLPSSTGPRLKQVTAFLERKSALLLLDNFEQVLDAAIDASRLLQACAQVKMLVTSRAALRIAGEQEYWVPPMRTPAPDRSLEVEELEQVESVALFIERARRIQPSFTITGENADAVAELVAQLDGLPLAIELAAARIRMFPPRSIVDQLRKSLEVLNLGPRDLPERQQTLQSAIAWSYELLEEPTQGLMRRMGIFNGGGRLENLVAVCRPREELGVDPLSGLETLVDHSLAQRAESTRYPRFRMLETIRAFGRTRLEESGELELIRERHALTFLELAERARDQLTGTDQNHWLDVLEEDHANLRNALQWAIEEDRGEYAHRLSESLWRFWQMRGHLNEASAWFDKVLVMDCPDPITRASALLAAGGVAFWQGDFERAHPHLVRAVEMYRKTEDRHGLAEALYNLSFTYGYVEESENLNRDMAAARELLNEALGIFNAVDDRLGQAKVKFQLGGLAYSRGAYEDSKQHLADSVQDLRSLDEPFLLGWALRGLGLAVLRTEGPDEAESPVKESLKIHAASRDISAIVLHLIDAAHLAVAKGDLEGASRLLGAMNRLAREIGTNIGQVDHEMVSDIETAIRSLDAETLERTQTEGAAMQMEEAIDYALTR